MDGEQVKVTVPAKQGKPKNFPVEFSGGFVTRACMCFPALILVGLGVGTRIAHPSFQFDAYDQALNRATTAYVPIVRDTERLVKYGNIGKLADLRSLGHRWVDGARDGSLKILQQCDYEDTGRDGVKGEIVRAASSVAEGLNGAAIEELRKGEAAAAVQDAILAADTLNTPKFFDFSSLSVVSMIQRRSLGIVEYALPRLNPKQRSAVLRDVAPLHSDPAVLANLMIKDRQLFTVYQLHQGVDPVAIEQSTRLVDATELLRTHNLDAAVKDLRKWTLASNSDLAPELYSDVRLGFMSAYDTDKMVDAIERS